MRRCTLLLLLITLSLSHLGSLALASDRPRDTSSTSPSLSKAPQEAKVAHTANLILGRIEPLRGGIETAPTISALITPLLKDLSPKERTAVLNYSSEIHTASPFLMLLHRRMGDSAFVQQLLDWGADPDVCEKSRGNNAMHVAAQVANIEGLKALLPRPPYEAKIIYPLLTSAFDSWVKSRVVYYKNDKSSPPLINELYCDIFIYLTSVAHTSPGAGALLIQLLATLKSEPTFSQEEKDFFPDHIGKMLRNVLSALCKNNAVLAKQIVNEPSNPSRFTSLGNAAYEGHAEFIPYLLLAGADVMHPSSISPAFIAAQRGEIECLAALSKNLSKDQKTTFLSQPDHDGITPLHTAAVRGHLATVEWLIKAGASRPVKIKGSFESPLTGAIGGGHLSQFPNNRISDIMTGLPVSQVLYCDENSEKVKNQVRTIGRLVELGAKWTGAELQTLVASDFPPSSFKNMKIPNEAWHLPLKENGTTALLFALVMGREDIVDYLLGKGMEYAAVFPSAPQNNEYLSALLVFFAVRNPNVIKYIPKKFLPKMFMHIGEDGLFPLLNLALFSEGQRFINSPIGDQVLTLCTAENPKLTDMLAFLCGSGEYSSIVSTCTSDEALDTVAEEESSAEDEAGIEESSLSSSSTEIPTEQTSPKKQRKAYLALSKSLESAEEKWREAVDKSGADWREIEAAFSRLIQSVDTSIVEAQELPQFSTCVLKAKRIAAMALYKMARANPLSNKLGMGHAYVTAHGPEVQYRALRARIQLQGLSNASRFSGAQPLATARARAEIANWLLLNAGQVLPGRYQGVFRMKSLEGEGTDAQGTHWTSEVVCGVVDIAKDGTSTLVTMYPQREETVRGGDVSPHFAPHLVELFKGLGN